MPHVHRTPLLLLLPLAASAQLPGNSDALLSVHAGPAVVEVTAPRAAGTLGLPALEFPLQIVASCPAAGLIDSVSISVADSSLYYSAADFETDSRLETTLTLPQKQTAPLDIGDFCSGSAATTTSDAAPADKLVFDELYSAHASLRCSLEAKQFIVYETLGLDVELHCETDTTEPDAAALFRSPRPRR